MKSNNNNMSTGKWRWRSAFAVCLIAQGAFAQVITNPTILPPGKKNFEQDADVRSNTIDHSVTPNDWAGKTGDVGIIDNKTRISNPIFGDLGGSCIQSENYNALLC